YCFSTVACDLTGIYCTCSTFDADENLLQLTSPIHSGKNAQTTLLSTHALTVFIFQLAHMILPEDENFLLVFRREAPLDNSVDFMKIWRKYDVDCSGYISAQELKAFLKDLFQQHHKEVPSDKLDDYTDTMMKIFDKNKDGRLDLNDLARILALQENFLLQFQMDACSKEERKRDFEKIFDHYDVSKTGALEGPEVDGFVKDMMGLVRPNITGPDLDQLRVVLLRHCDVNKDGKIQKNELALCLGVKPKP
uniref:Secretagogin n=2 Tax=Stegastes partitus TaxID=144197 RepID=A0A3B4ZEE0_9TELE